MMAWRISFPFVHLSTLDTAHPRDDVWNRELAVAQKVSVQLVDDLDGSEAEATVEFGLDGASYAIDLSAENSAELRDALALYVDNARRTGGRRRPLSTATKPSKARPVLATPVKREQKQAIRAWARKQGWAVADRGRIPGEVMDAYNNAH